MIKNIFSLYKSFITNLLALIFLFIGYATSSNIIFNISIFALSGALTNWLAIYMLFDKVPLLYGSGVIPNRFEDFKSGIKNLIIKEFFNKKNISDFFNVGGLLLNPAKINQKIDFDKIFNQLIKEIAESPLGGMLSLIGGIEALSPLKEPITKRLKITIEEIIKDFELLNSKDKLLDVIEKEISLVIDNRLDQLTPKMVKDIIQEMIRKHLGWLVVWGGFFGGLIGAIYTIF